MSKFKGKYRSESHRWQFWDYSSPSAYYITVVTVNRENVLGKIINKQMLLSKSGQIVNKYIQQINNQYDNVILDEYTIMPDHFHCIIIITDDEFELPIRTDENYNEYELCNHVDTIHELYPIRTDTIHELYLRGLRQSKIVKQQYNFTDPLSEHQKKQYIKMRRKMLIPKIMGKMKMKISMEINILNNTPKRKNLQSDYDDRIILFTEDYFRIKDYIINNPAKYLK